MNVVSKKRVLIFSTAYFPLVGGAEVAVKEITNRLGDEFEFDLITARIEKGLEKQEQIGNVNVYRLGIGYPKIDKIILSLFGGMFGAKLHRQKKYDAVWAIMASFGGFAALSFKQKTGVPFLLTLQEGDPLESILHKVRFVRGRFNKIFTRADGLQAISNYLLEWGKKMKFAGKVSEVVPNGVDVSRFTSVFDSSAIQNIRNEFDFGENATVLVTASRLVEKNGVEHIIRALPLLPESVCLVVCGTGSLEPSLQKLSVTLGVEKRIRWLGNISHDELPRVLSACDIFIRPSLTEGLGNSFLEAMAVGLPTIGTPVGGIPDFLFEGKTGFFCQPQHPLNIAETVLRVMKTSVEQKKNMHENALKLIREKYNWEYISLRMKWMLNEIIHSS